MHKGEQEKSAVCMNEREKNTSILERETISKSEPKTPDTECVSIKLADISARLHQVM